MRAIAAALLLAACTRTVVVKHEPWVYSKPDAWTQDAWAKEKLRKAKLWMTAGLIRYALGDFHDAVRFWRAEYPVDRDVAALYNLALAYRNMGQPRHALWVFRAYLREAPGTDERRVDVEQAIRDLRAHLPDTCPSLADEDHDSVTDGPPPSLWPEEWP